MYEHHARGIARALAAVVAVAVAALCLAACQQPAGSSAGRGAGGQGNAPVPSGYGVVFLGPGDCSSRGTIVREVSCRSEKASARVLARYTGAPSAGPGCPPPTDFVLHIAAGARAMPRGYACMRSLEPPHPGDPGLGGGPLTVVGDCVYGSREGEVRETACDGSGERAPEFEVASAVGRRALCPATTDLYVQLGGDEAVGGGGCAHRL